MAINMITGYTGEPHVTSSQAGAGNAGMYGTDRYILNVLEKLYYELLSNNLIRIKSGMILNQGRLMGIDYNDYVDLEIDNGQSGKKRCDLVVCTYSKNVENGIESAALKIVKGTSGDDYVVPEYETGNILANAVLDDFPLYKIYIDGLSVDSVTKIADVGVNITNISTQITQLQTLTTKLSQDVAILKQGFQRQLFSGAQKTGSIQLDGQAYQYKYLVLYINSSTTGTPFGTGIFPVLKTPPSQQAVLFTDTTADNNHSTYMGKFSIANELGSVLTIDRQVTNVTHISGSNHGGVSSYYIREIWGVF